jgi:hypothetical protein
VLNGPLGVVGDALVSRSLPPRTLERRPCQVAEPYITPMPMPMQAKLPAFGSELAVQPASSESAVAVADVALARELEGPSLMMRHGGLRRSRRCPPSHWQAANLNAGPTGPSRHGSRRGLHAGASYRGELPP